jgi:hypothetical protein
MLPIYASDWRVLVYFRQDHLIVLLYVVVLGLNRGMMRVQKPYLVVWFQEI